MTQETLPLNAEKKPKGPVECLGMTFENDEARRAYFLEKLREKLKDPEFKKIEGFPIGTDEDILALSDPPYYTACPNPFIEDFIRQYGKPYNPAVPYNKEPFAADVSEGKNDPIYNAHSYHTKVPHKAIMRYILHYTEPGDVVFDGFCGTGMTGVAAQMCGDKNAVESLGVSTESPDQKYKVDADNTIFEKQMDENGKAVWVPFSKLGARKAVLNDLSPAATFIAYNYNTPVDVVSFEKEAKWILAEVEKECGWMYETKHSDGRTGKINYTVWSDVFVCPECSYEVIFWEAAVDKEAGKVKDEFPCPHCSASLTKRNMERAWVNKFDSAIKQMIRQAKQVPVLINYTVGGKRAEKVPDAFDMALIEKIEQGEVPYWFPTTQIPKGDKTGEPLRIGITHAHHFYTKRNLWILSAIRNQCKKGSLLFLFNSQLINISKLNRYRPGVSFPYNPLSGTLYVGSQVSESCVFTAYRNKLKKLTEAFKKVDASSIISTKSTTTGIDFGADYIFIDPPFGANLNYSELSFLWESWLKISTNIKHEAIESKKQGKGSTEYRHLMAACFKEAYRVLKPGRWMTVEFSNTKASVWNSIQTALMEAGFIVANVAALDKQQGSFNAVTNTTSVKQDLVISVYKPNGGLEERFMKEAETEEGVWDFVRTHLRYLPRFKEKQDTVEFIVERDPRILYDRMVSYYVQHGFMVPLSTQEFQAGLTQRFAERDGMIFLPEQVAEYDKKRLQAKTLEQRSLFVNDERSAIDWLQEFLKARPSTNQDIQPEFMKQLGAGWKKHEAKPEMSELLRQNFLEYDGKGEVPSQIHSYLSTNFKDLRNLPKDDPALQAKARDRWYVPDPNKASDLEKLREKTLLKEFEEYRASTLRKLKVFRLEAVRAGFKKAWQERDYQIIIEVAKKIPEDVLQEDSKLLMWYDQALTRVGGA